MFEIVTTTEADVDVRSTSLYLYAHSPQGADAWLHAYLDAVEKLKQNADCCPVAEENDLLTSN